MQLCCGRGLHSEVAKSVRVLDIGREQRRGRFEASGVFSSLQQRVVGVSRDTSDIGLLVGDLECSETRPSF